MTIFFKIFLFILNLMGVAFTVLIQAWPATVFCALVMVIMLSLLIQEILSHKDAKNDGTKP